MGDSRNPKTIKREKRRAEKKEAKRKKVLKRQGLDRGDAIEYDAPGDIQPSVWDDQVCVTEPDFWSACGVKVCSREGKKEREVLCPVSEGRRVQRYEALRKKLRKLCGDRYPSLAFERWALSARQTEESLQRAEAPGRSCRGRDPLIPCNETGHEDATLRADLIKLGKAPLAAEKLCRALTSHARSAVRDGEDAQGGRADGFGRSGHAMACSGGRMAARASSSSSPSSLTCSSCGFDGFLLGVRAEEGTHNFVVGPAAAAAAGGRGGAGPPGRKRGLGQGGNGSSSGSSNYRGSGMASYTLPGAVLDKLRELWARSRRTYAPAQHGLESKDKDKDKDKGLLTVRLYTLLQRYSALGGFGFQAALPPQAFHALKTLFGVQMECFASPLNCYFERYCSAFPDVDGPFGSVGSFFDFHPKSGSFEANPPFSPPLMSAMLRHIERLLGTSAGPRGEDPGGEDPGGAGPLSFAVVVPVWEDGEAGAEDDVSEVSGHFWGMLQKSPFLAATLKIPRGEHAWRDGSMSNGGGGGALRRRVPCDTAVCFLQNERGRREWPASEESLNTLRRCSREESGASAEQSDPSQESKSEGKKKRSNKEGKKKRSNKEGKKRSNKEGKKEGKRVKKRAREGEEQGGKKRPKRPKQKSDE